MNWLRELGRRLWILFHRELRVQEQIDAGLAAHEARRAVRRRFGNPMVLREESRDMWGWTWLEHAIQDLRYGSRVLMKNPGFTAVAVVSLGLGIGANTAIFTLINNVMLKSLPVRDPEQLVSFGKAEGGGVIGGLQGAVDIFSYDFYKQIESQDGVFQGLCGFGSFPVAVAVRSGASAGPADHAFSQLVSGTYFSVLGINALLGRSIDPSDADAPGRQPVAVISYDFWRRSFSGDPAVKASRLR